MSPSPKIDQGPAVVRRRLDQVVGRIRLLHASAGSARLVSLVVLALVAAYSLDRMLDLPRALRAVALLVGLGLFGRECWRKLLRPLIAGPSRLDAARLVEGELSFEGRLISSLQLPEGPPGSLEHKVFAETAEACERLDLRTVLTARPSMYELARALGALVALALLLALVQPYSEVFLKRWSMGEVPWPRETRLSMLLAEQGPVHVRDVDGTVVVARAGSLSLQANWEGLRPERVELVVEGLRGERTSPLTLGSSGLYQGHFTVEPGDTALRVRGGDDVGDENRLLLSVIEPPRLDNPDFVLTPPAYIGGESVQVGAADLVVSEGTTVLLRGRPVGAAVSATLWRQARGESVALDLTEDGQGVLVTGEFVAGESDTLTVRLTGTHGLATPEPGRIPLLVHEDRSPTLRVYAPARSDVKVTANGVVPLSVMAEDDHGVSGTVLQLEPEGQLDFAVDPDDPAQYRLVLDLATLGLTETVAYAIEAADRRDLGERGPQRVRIEGRRIDIVSDSEVQRLLADRQLRLKENFSQLRERQLRAQEVVDDLLIDPPQPGDSDLVTAAVAQNQVTARLSRETRELCAVLDEMILNRLDSGPGAETLLQRRLADWHQQAVDEPYSAAVWTAMAGDYAAGRFGRLDVAGRLLDMAAIALRLSETSSPAAHELLSSARQDPSVDQLQGARRAQDLVINELTTLLDRMDEWEDYQEVLTLLKSLIDDQRVLRERSQQALSNTPGNN
ncbi:MAG: hypothetical protein ACI9EF_001106 [Pseudohongiellaceae bacterium]|jgi:hypothetical protein